MDFSKGSTGATWEVTALQYKAALHELLLSAPPVLDTKAKVVPNFVSNVKQVTPGALLAVHKSFMPIVQGGCGNLVLRSKQVLVSLHTTVAERNILEYWCHRELIVCPCQS